MTTTKHPSAWLFILFPAIAMLLGWGLRGYIGGGPFAAMIPGCFVALCLCLLLGYTKEAAAMAALFGAIGIGYGGDMTYGQTLGFLRQPGNTWWGLLGCLIKGGIWGLLGGAVLGIGLTRWRFAHKNLVAALLLSVVAFYIGIKLINDPKLLYFSDPVNEPRDESWAGLLFAAIAILGYLRIRGEQIAIPLSFAFWGTIGGAAGFAGGALWMVCGPGFPIEQKWIGWWKMMEFTFGLLLGAALGFAGWRNRNALQEDAPRTDSPGSRLRPVVLLVLYTAVWFLAETAAMNATENWTPETSGDYLFTNASRLIFSFIFFGAVTLLLGMRSLHAAWQVAITLTFFHTVLDYVQDLAEPVRLGFEVPLAVQMAILILATLALGIVVYFIQRKPDPIRPLFLLLIWSCYLIATLRSFVYHHFFFPPDGQNFASIFLSEDASIIFVHGTFTVSAIVTTAIVYAIGARATEEA